ncbi:hypothetical protein L208DRAFT_1399211 [Tricholoma matsutake]|nr:hypothetical protein L208DRAFT_1399211 [Tricholoma matsutake 945]
MIQKGFCDIYHITLPAGEAQDFRDQSLRATCDAGLGAFNAAGDLEPNLQQEEFKEIYGYDAEDEADNWCNEWGLLKRSIGQEVSIGIISHCMVECKVWIAYAFPFIIIVTN